MTLVYSHQCDGSWITQKMLQVWQRRSFKKRIVLIKRAQICRKSNALVVVDTGIIARTAPPRLLLQVQPAQDLERILELEKGSRKNQPSNVVFPDTTKTFVDTHCHLEYVYERYRHSGSLKDFQSEVGFPRVF